MNAFTIKAEAIIKRSIAKDLYFKLNPNASENQYLYVYMTWNRNNKSICKLKTDILSQFSIDHINKCLI